ncbi:imidazolonepropionase-like amidohydrolase [Pseudoduganella flava]|uniref:Amidohydrolase family protein n=1 Tax=Pseudoduganella flava TaxID=871742 RepID=A0A562Q5F6_9BURK|nr:amidohydrolase family protein [Pseudoduganella flava]QGZ41454.1 amidohydrolase family protein [Pseudoduganella flava]TWI51410.1 imidazolonepropionase-like amidohydrolase [Pseudoduganella flava]
MRCSIGRNASGAQGTSPGAPGWTAAARLLAVAVLAGAAGCAATRPADTGAGPWLVTGTRLYVAPDRPPLTDAWLLVKGGKIDAVGTGTPRAGHAAGPAACNGGVIVAGFQNSHVHFMDDAFANAKMQAPADLQRALTRMLTRYGYTNVVDTGSELANTTALRRRIADGTVAGPEIVTAGSPLYPANGIPFYLAHLPADTLGQLAQPATAGEAVATVRQHFAEGAGGTKLFVASPVGEGRIRRMDPAIARAAAEETHRQGGLVMVHPTDPEGVRIAVAAGVDVVVHTTIDPPGSTWTGDLIAEMVARKVAVVPTLKLWRYELDKDKVPADVQDRIAGPAERQVKAFLDAGGQVLFGTDVGYMTDYDPTGEYVLMAHAGMTPMQILSSLTTAPAARWRQEAVRGRLEPGMAANVVVLAGDPVDDVRRFADVTCTVAGGRVIYQRD